MSSPKDSNEEKKGFNSQYIGLFLLVAAFVVSLVVATINTYRVDAPNRNVIRIAHWQLERGYREAMQAVIEEYQKLHPGVEIEQMPVTERVYAQWLNTHLISGTAPDLCELGMSNLATKDEYTVKYFLPLSGVITQVNPYNADNEMRDTPWKETLIDGMRGGFREGLQEYYGVPTTMLSMRLFYNKDLLKAATGSDAAPQTFGEWMSQCEALRAYGKKIGKKVVPFASSYKMNTIQPTLDVAFTSSYETELDIDLNGEISQLEAYIGFRQGKVTLNDPSIQALYTSVKKIGDQMQRGFSAMDRQEAQYKFVNGLAGFTYTGSWDVSGIFSQAQAKGFEVGICQLPIPAASEPNGNLVRGRANEASSNGAGNYGVYKKSKKIDQAIDFLMFLTSRRGNEQLNKKAEWPPVTIGAEASELMKPFQLDPRGYYARVSLNYGSRVLLVADSNLINYYQGDAPFSDFEQAFQEVIVDPNRGGDWAWWYEYDQRRRDTRNKERLLAQDNTLELIHPGTRDPERNRRAILQQVTRNNAMDYLWLFRTYRQGDPTQAWSQFQPVFP